MQEPILESNKKNPNLLFVFSDQHRWCDLGCYGNKEVRSPNLDYFAQEAIRFENCISNSPVCVPARGSMLTGLMPLKHGAITNDLPIYYNVESIADVLNDAGYNTGYIGKWHLAGIPRDQCIPEGRGRLGFAEWKVWNCSHEYLNARYYDEKNNIINMEGYEPVGQTELAIDFIKRNRDINWGLFLSWGPPHDPYFEVPSEYLELYEDTDITLRYNVPDIIKQTMTRSITREQIVENYKGYYAHITALDEQFGRLLSVLKETGQFDNTIIVYTSDHGDMLGSQGLTNKQLPYEESVKVPLLVCWKDRTVQAVSEELISLLDLPVSLLGMIGLNFNGEVDGMDLHRLFTDKSSKGRKECYIFDLIPCHQAAARGDSEWRGIRTQRYTFARTASDEGFLLFDNREDPYQQSNLIDKPEYQYIKHELELVLRGYIAAHDKLLPWDRFIREYGLVEEWNRSQTYFNLPALDNGEPNEKTDSL